MIDRPPSGLERLWRREELDRKPRLGLSLDRVVQSGIELADGDGLGAVSMKRVAERLGFTTMSLYRYVTSKDELLLLMHDTVWQPPAGLDVPAGRLARRPGAVDPRAVRDHGSSIRGSTRSGSSRGPARPARSPGWTSGCGPGRRPSQ